MVLDFAPTEASTEKAPLQQLKRPSLKSLPGNGGGGGDSRFPSKLDNRRLRCPRNLNQGFNGETRDFSAAKISSQAVRPNTDVVEG